MTYKVEPGCQESHSHSRKQPAGKRPIEKALNCAVVIGLAGAVASLSGCIVDPRTHDFGSPEDGWRAMTCEQLVPSRKLYTDWLLDHPNDASTIQAIGIADRVIVEKGCQVGPVVPVGQLGIKMDNLTAAVAQGLALNPVRGVLVVEVFPGAGAEKAGVKPMDVILELAGQEIKQVAELQAMVRKMRVGVTVPLRVWRGGALKDLNVEVTPRTAQPQ